MTGTNQKLREACNYIDALGGDSRSYRQALALPTAEQVDDINVAESFTSVTKTAAPDMPLSMNQFGRLVELTREHLTDNTFVYKATSKAGDTCHFGVESAAKAWAKGGTVEPIKVREFKLHTSALTAAPVGELPEPVMRVDMNDDGTWGELQQSYWESNLPTLKADDPLFTADQMRAYALSALSAGDAVDAQRYRWLREQHWSNSAICCVYKPKQNVRLGGTCPSGYLLDSVIDAAMRKGQL